ncbi:MAG: hypothetical protein SNI70_02060 [Rikenellaceae bacterium]
MAVNFTGEKISQINCKATAGIGYAFRMQIFFKKKHGLEWKEANESKSITLGFTGKYDLSTISGIEEGDEVRLGLNVSAGPDRKANESFEYQKDSKKYAYYEATGACTNATLRYEGIKEL